MEQEKGKSVTRTPAAPISPAARGTLSAGRGPMTGDKPDYGALYSSHCQGEFYGADYYKPPTSDIESSIIYDDNEDKRVTAAMLVAAFGPRRAVEAGCATGLLVKALRGSGVDAWGFDFSGWCVENAHPAVKDHVVWGDVLDLGRAASAYYRSRLFVSPADSAQPAGKFPAAVGPEESACGGLTPWDPAVPLHDLVLTLDILEHLPPDRVHTALANLTALIAPGGILFAVIPAYGANAFGPELYPLKYDEWKRDAAAGIPFCNIPLDNHGRPHLGHLTHATIDWWEKALAEAGLERLGEVERLLHQRFDDRLEFARRSFFAFAYAGKKPEDKKVSFLKRLPFLSDPVHKIGKRLLERIAAVPGLPRGFYEWELWGDRWVRWTDKEAWDLIETRGRTRLLFQAVCHHPDIAASPVQAAFQIDAGPITTIEFRDHDWHELTLKLPRRPFCGLHISCSRTWIPDPNVPPSQLRSLGAGICFRPKQ